MRPISTDSPASRIFRHNVRERLPDGGLSELARRTGFCRPFLSRMMNGHHAVTLPTAEAIATALGVKLEELIRAPARGVRRNGR